MPAQFLYGETNPIDCPIATDKAVDTGSLVGISSGTLVNASDETWDTNLATTQVNFVARFLGVAGQTKDNATAQIRGNSIANRCRVDTDGTFLFATASASYNVGDIVGPAKASGNALLNDTVASVAALDKAIGYVVEKTTSATTVKVRLQSVKAPNARIS
jgi:hypothetical protein